MCDTVVVVGESCVLFAKNSDRDPNESQVLEWHPRASHEAGASVRCTWIVIPQVAETYATLISRPFWMWGAEIGTNEHGVTIGNEAVFTTEPYADSGLTGMDMLRLALERAATAEQAVDVLRELLERYGQGGGCGHEKRSFTYHNSFLVADAGGAFVLETAGRQWAVERVTGGVRSISNGLTIPGFAERYGDRVRSGVSRCRVRQQVTARGAATADGTASSDVLMRVLRTHASDDGPSYSPVNGAMAAPCMHAGGLIASSQTTASWVAELRPGNAQHWATATAAPCVSLFKPVRVEEPVDLGPLPTDAFDPRTLWWRHEHFHRVALRNPRAGAAAIAERDEVERRWLREPPSSAEAFAEADRLLDRWTALVGTPEDARPWWVRRYWHERALRAGLPHSAPARDVVGR